MRGEEVFGRDAKDSPAWRPLEKRKNFLTPRQAGWRGLLRQAAGLAFLPGLAGSLRGGALQVISWGSESGGSTVTGTPRDILPRADVGCVNWGQVYVRIGEPLEITIRMSAIPADPQPSFLPWIRSCTPTGKIVCGATPLTMPGPCSGESEIVMD